jgi:hypothetical protein
MLADMHSCLLGQVGNPEALAFFVPGICSGLCAAIRQCTVDAPGVRACSLSLL